MTLDFNEYMKRYLDGDRGDDSDDEGENIISPLLSLNRNCQYYDIDDIPEIVKHDHTYRHTGIHLNIHSLPSKYDQLRGMLSHLTDLGIIIDYIMLCETFLSDTNS